MNCQEYRDMIEDALDISLHGELELRVRRHLEHCEGCRAYFVRRRSEHVLLFTSVNAAYSHLRPPPDGFADRIVREVEARRNARRSWRRLALPRWALIAASLALMVGFVFAATVVVEIIPPRRSAPLPLSQGESELPIQGSSPYVTAQDSNDVAEQDSSFLVVQDSNSVAVQDCNSPSKIEGVAARPGEYESSTDNRQPTTDYQLKGENQMKKGKAAAAALTAAMAAAPLAAANGDEYQFIISGDPVAAETVDTRESASAGTALVTSTHTSPAAAASLEARYRTFDESDGIKLRTDSPKGMIISVK